MRDTLTSFRFELSTPNFSNRNVNANKAIFRPNDQKEREKLNSTYILTSTSNSLYTLTQFYDQRIRCTGHSRCATVNQPEFPHPQVPDPSLKIEKRREERKITGKTELSGYKGTILAHTHELLDSPLRVTLLRAWILHAGLSVKESRTAGRVGNRPTRDQWFSRDRNGGVARLRGFS